MFEKHYYIVCMTIDQSEVNISTFAIYDLGQIADNIIIELWVFFHKIAICLNEMAQIQSGVLSISTLKGQIQIKCSQSTTADVCHNS